MSGSRVLLGLSLDQWEILVFLGVLAGVVGTVLFAQATWWVGVGLFVTAIVFGHLCLAADRYVGLPGLMVFSACLQWIFTPCLSELFPPSFPQYRMLLPLDVYMAYAVPATAALWIGFHLPAQRVLNEPRPLAPTRHLPQPLRRTLDGVIVVGLVLSEMWGYVPAGLAFLVHILASFRFLAALCWMLTGTPRWGLRVALVFGHLILQTTAQGLFYHLFHWGSYFLLVYSRQKRWRWALGGMLLLSLGGAVTLQWVKPDYRLSVEGGEVSGIAEQSAKLGSLLWERITGTGHFTYSFGDVVVRFNQGWIVARIMHRVPDHLPYAQGDTLAEAVLYSIAPRALFPEKRAGASKTLFARYTGIELRQDTSMGLGVIGELYANFGRLGGIVGTFVYGLLFGLVFWRLARRADDNPLWWALIPVVFLPLVEPSWNFEDITNHITKSGAVVLALYWGLPTWRRLFQSGGTPVGTNRTGHLRAPRFSST